MDDNHFYSYRDFLDSYNADATEQHTVVDMRSHPRSQGGAPVSAPAKPTKRPRAKRRARGVVIVVSLVILLFFAVLLALDFVMPNGIAVFVSEAFAPAGNYAYAVCYAAYDSLDEARRSADGVRVKGGAGFIAFDGQYKVLLSAYPTQEDAQSVADKHGYSVMPLRTDGLQADDFPLAVRGKVKSILSYHTDLYAKLYEWSDQLAQNGTNVDYCRQRIAALRDALQSNAQPFLDATQSMTDATCANYRSTLLGVIASLDNLVNHTDDAHFLADMRWTYIMVLRTNRL